MLQLSRTLISINHTDIVAFKRRTECGQLAVLTQQCLSDQPRTCSDRWTHFCSCLLHKGCPEPGMVKSCFLTLRRCSKLTKRTGCFPWHG